MEVYQIKNLVNGKVYIGSTTGTAYGRCYNPKSGHFTLARRGDDYPLYNDIRKYGESNFEISVLETVEGDESRLRLREDYWIKNCKAELYNCCNAANPWWDSDKQSEFVEIRKAKYGDAAFNLHTPDVIARSVATRKERYGSLTSHMRTSEITQKRRRSNSRLIKQDGKYFYGAYELCNYLNDLGYEISASSVKRLLNGKFITKFKDLVGKFELVNLSPDYLEEIKSTIERTANHA